MTCRGGGGVAAKMVMMMLTVVNIMPMMATGRSPPHYDEGDCRVTYSVQVDGQPLNTSLLAYVSYSTNVVLGFFTSKDFEKERYAVSFNSTGATYAEVPNGEGLWMPMALPMLIPEGWNTFRVAVVEKNVTVTLVLGQDTVTLLTLPPLRTSTDTMLARGNVALCSRVTPTWKVSAGEEVKVLLQPAGGNGRHQWVEVSGEGWGAASPYVAFPFAPGSNRTYLPANTTFRITSSLRGASVHYEVFKVAKNGGGDGHGDEEVMSGNVPINNYSLWLMVGGGRGGDGSNTTTTTLISLLPSSPQTKSTDNYVPSSPSTYYRISFFVVLGLLVLLVVVVVLDVVNGHRVLASLLKCYLTSTAAEGQESGEAHGNGVCRREGSQEDINDLGSSSSPLLVPPAQIISMQTNPHGSPSSRGDMNPE